MMTFNSKFFLSILFLSFLSVNAQSTNQEEIDSLTIFLKENPKSIFVHYKLAELLKDVDTIAAFQYLNSGLQYAKQTKDDYGIGKGQFLLADFYLDFNQPKKSEYYYRAADIILSQLITRDSSEENLRLWVRNTFNIGVVRSLQGFNEDIKYIEEITPIAKKIGLYEILAKGNTNIGIGFYNTGQNKKAYKYFKIGGPQHIHAKDYQSYAINKLLFASCLLSMDSLKTAKKQLDIVKPILDTIKSAEKNQLYHTVLGQYFRGNKEFKKAIVNLEKAERIQEDRLQVSNNLQLYLDFMRTYGEMKDYDTAIAYAEKSLSISKEVSNYTIMADIYKHLSEYNTQKGLVDAAFEALNNYVVISDTLHIKELEREVVRLESKFRSEKKDYEILELKNQKANAELKLVNKQSQNYLLFSICMGLLVLASIAFFGYRNFKKQNQLKSAEITRLEYEQESKVYNAMLEGQENERKRLAIDLHDGLAGRLSATRIKLERLAKKNENKKTEKDFRDAAQYIDNSLKELRGIAMNLMPETLFKYGLKNAVEDYCSAISSGLDDVKFILQFYDTEIELPKNVALTVYRIIQELINNAVKHAKASEVLVQYLVADNRINITVEDNGGGFSMQDIEDKGGMGLNNLKTRVKYLNGEIDFDSIVKEGTNVNIVIDL